MERINWHEKPIADSGTQQPLGRMLVPMGQPDEEEKPKKRRRVQDDGRKRRRLIVHLVILVVLLALIVFGIRDFLYEGPRKSVPQPNAAVRVSGDSLSASE